MPSTEHAVLQAAHKAGMVVAKELGNPNFLGLFPAWSAISRVLGVYEGGKLQKYAKPARRLFVKGYKSLAK